MRAMVLSGLGRGELELRELPVPVPGPSELLIKVSSCGVCRTDLHVVDGELANPSIPIVPGHEIVGIVEAAGADVAGFSRGQRVGVPWLSWTCGVCEFCRADHENLCPNARFTGYTARGGYAEYTTAEASFCVALPPNYDDLHAAPLLCAGLIGYRAYRLAGPGERLGIYGFGAAAHLVAQVATHQRRQVYAFVRPGDEQAARFAREMGASWAGGSDQPPPLPLDCALIFAPVGALVPAALSHVKPGGTVICAGIHMSDIPSFPYRLLWEERSLRSVANLTRTDAKAFLELAATIPLRTKVRPYALTEANRALEDLREGRLSGAAVIVP